MDNNRLKRYFIAFNLPLGLKRKLAIFVKELAANYDGVKWVEEDCFHITMHFLGNLDESQAEKVKLALQTFDKKFNCIELSIDGLGAFPNLTHPRIIHLSSHQTNGNYCIKLVELIGQKMIQQGIKIDERSWRPHITLGRVREGNDISLSKEIKFDFTDKILIESFDLMESVPTRRGPEYILVEKFLFI